ncbi:undecaprenyldiphospho-muramoylpentapeptide beta-N-acetylglucosaminyltransferase [Limnohabitans sp. Rim8]|jgi:UDP-N-acetylglucosamine--N-acetylmuramyl-(pentapeptide) pyrophosphoryl-undecaprenol N-acetylglucosamine transferase|uniref:undecaprenyldiphospho-muramoylpentapeptide beta-N-acetylglucosaminyltransferase n=1 Tax=Limnohabitans sp. Rim8 TaxID=1100718 RepID=UPI0025DA91A0|nr:undecaprenyldiphospho-muramoylpentapeptide beta-N-acetylglucosaminyltransferase [Limnohabitans sp. Rim8]
MNAKCALVMAGGTGGHIFPGLAVAQALRDAGWRVHWLGAPNSMESQLVPAHGFPFEAVAFGGVRGKGLTTLAVLPLKLLRAFWQSWQVLRRVRPDVVLGLGGYITFPGGMMASLYGKPLVLHEQNSVAGMANKVLSQLADRVFTAFPDVFKQGHWVGNPLRSAFTQQAAPAERFAGRTGPLRVLVVGGSLGAKALNDSVPQALALMPLASRPVVVHQSGAKQIDALRTNYQAAGVEAELTPFIDDTASAFAQADVVICRAGASTVTELAAVGVAAVFVPFPHAVDDHQTTNAQFLVAKGGGWLMPQADLSPQALANFLTGMTREQLLVAAQKAHDQRQTNATQEVVMACEELAA